MKNTIYYYYTITPEAIHQTGKQYRFHAEGSDYLLLTYEDIQNINEIYDLDRSLLSQGIYVHQIILNNQKNIITPINQENYVLLKIFIQKKDITLQDILAMNSLYIQDRNGRLTQQDWASLWSKKIDYLEYQMNQIGKKYPLLVESFSYYIGLAETAITLVNMTNKKDLYYTLNHRRITVSDTTYSLYNPFNLVIDYRMRDVCDYFKSCFFDGENVYLKIEQYIQEANLTNNEKNLFLARMLFPTYYFDCYEKIIDNKVEEKEIQFIIRKANQYEEFLKTIYQYLNVNRDLIEIEWLKKVIQY